MQRNTQTVGGKTIGGADDRAGDDKKNPGHSFPFPRVIYREYIPEYDLFASEKCLAWRIEYPSYSSNYDFNLIPGVLALKANGELNSFNFLNTTDPANTFASTISLYHGDKLRATRDMWAELDHALDGPGNSAMEGVQFVKANVDLESIQDWVTKRPDLFINRYPEKGGDYELAYAAGDFIQYHLTTSNRYGGIRIVSMSPRIIEVYLAVPND